VIFRATEGLGTLLDLRYKRHYRAQRGQHGRGKNMHGRDGQDLIVPVPVGTVIRDAHTGQLIADLDEDGKEAVVARGGRGGLGNAHFATPTRQAPRFAQPGEPGQERELIVELKLLADVGLIGLPNAGKSTLLSVVSAARPKIAPYPFTTLRPVLGMVKVEELGSFVLADIPGLIEGAHKGAGLGFQFLRHVERCKLLLHLVDVSEAAPQEPVEALQKINRELSLYSPLLSEKPQVVVATKLDVASPERLRQIQRHCQQGGIDFFAISAVRKEGLRELLQHVARRLKAP